MATRFVVNEWSREEWQEMTAEFPNLNVYQTWEYAKAHSASPLRSVRRAALFAAGRPVVLAQVRVKRLPILGRAVADIDWGPLSSEEFENGRDNLLGFLCDLQDHCLLSGLQLRVSPRSSWEQARDTRLIDILADAGLELDPYARPYRTYVIDLRPEISILHKSLHGKWRNQLRASERASLRVESGRSPNLFERFLAIYRRMRRDKRFPTGVDVSAIQVMNGLLPPDRRLLVSIATDGKSDVGATVCASFGNTMLYLLGATCPRARARGRPGYILQWSNLQLGKALGHIWYDTGGFDLDLAPDLARFKQRMGGAEVVFPGRYVASGGAGSRILPVLERVYRGLRGRTRR